LRAMRDNATMFLSVDAVKKGMHFRWRLEEFKMKNYKNNHVNF